MFLARGSLPFYFALEGSGRFETGALGVQEKYDNNQHHAGNAKSSNGIKKRFDDDLLHRSSKSLSVINTVLLLSIPRWTRNL